MDNTHNNVNKGPIAVLGAGGTMGQGMARNVAAAGIEVRAWNRTAAKLDDLAGEARIEAFASAAEAVANAAVVVTMLSDADATLAAMSDAGVEPAGGDGMVWAQMGTIGVEGSERCAELARDRGLAYFDAPVLGTKQPAEQGQLVILASGPEERRERLEPLFDAVGKRTIWLGAAGQGSRLKVVVNTWICTVVEGTAEMLRLAIALDLDPRLAFEAVADGPLDTPYMRNKGEAMLAGDFSPSFRLALAAKDARLAVAAGRDAEAEIPAIEAIAAQLGAVAESHPDEDFAATFRGRSG